MCDPRLSEIAADLDRAAEDAATEARPGDAIRLLRFAADLRHLQRLTGDIPMGQVADTIHKLNQQILQANADRDAAKADAAKAAADVERLNSLTAAGRVLDDADVAALAEANAVPANGPTDNAGTPADAGAAASVPPPAPDAAGTQPQPAA